MTVSASPALGQPRTKVRRAAVIFHPGKDNVKALKKAVKASARSGGWTDTLWLETTAEDPGSGMAAQALAAGVELVLASGGDGTVRAVAHALRGSGVALGIVPGGTGNLLARNLNLPLSSTAEAVAIAFSGDDRSIDAGVAELTRADGTQVEAGFVVMAGLGLDAALIANTNSALKQRVGWLAYVESGIRSLPNAEKIHIRYRIDDQSERHAHVGMILTGNCGVLPGNIELMPGARLDDGELDIAVLQPRNLFGWLTIWHKVGWEDRVLRRSALGRRIVRYTGSDTSTMLTYLRGRGITIRVDDPQDVELDGDGFGAVMSIHLWADAGALVVKVPL
ncbi:MAG: diacylglycerol kinase family protein [Microbacteriaceae bacterium]